MTRKQSKTLSILAAEQERRISLGKRRAAVAHLIRHELSLRGYTQRKLADELGCSYSNITKVVQGRGHSEMVLNGLRGRGVPESLLFDPRRSLLPSLKELKDQEKA